MTECNLHNKRIAIIGSGDLGCQVLHMIHSDTNNKVIGFFDDTKQKGEIVSKVKILGKIDDVNEFFKLNYFDEIICAIGYNHLKVRSEICNEIDNLGIPFYTFIHSSCYIDSSALIERGCILYPRVILDQRVRIKKNTILNLNSLVSHDSVIGESCFISPNVSIAGFCSLGNFCNIGISSTVIDNIMIGDSVHLGGGALVLNNIQKSGLYVGSPCYKIK